MLHVSLGVVHKTLRELFTGEVPISFGGGCPRRPNFFISFEISVLV